MSRAPAPFLLVLGLLAACGDGQPFFNEGPDVDGDGDPDELSRLVELPPGTEDPSRNRDINRHEGDTDNGGGMVTDVEYNEARDTFLIDNLAFDGENEYSRDNLVPTLAGYRVYEADVVTDDFLTGEAVSQIVPYRALVGFSENNNGNGDPRTSFVIVRTGGYVDYGFGGFVYERDGSVVLPNGGQATFSGDYAGIRVFDGRAGMEYTTGDMEINIDFDDFNSNEGITGYITDRAAYDVNGNEIPLGGEGQLVLPNVAFTVAAGYETLDDNGEISGQLASQHNGSTYEEGVYYGILSGNLNDPDDGGEIVGIVVMESDDPRFSGVTAQETGGFIVYR